MAYHRPDRYRDRHSMHAFVVCVFADFDPTDYSFRVCEVDQQDSLNDWWKWFGPVSTVLFALNAVVLMDLARHNYGLLVPKTKSQ